MKSSFLTRFLTGASATVLATTGVMMGGAAHAATAQPMFSYAQGWRVDQHVRELADVNGDGRADVVGFGNTGVQVAFGLADGTFSTPRMSVRNFSAAQGWSKERHVRTMADVDGDRRDDIVGFGDAGVYVAYSQGDGGFTAPELKVRDFGYAQGWRVGQHPRMLADANVQGPEPLAAADVIGYGYAGVSTAYSLYHGEYTEVDVEPRNFGRAQGWDGDRHLRTHADINVDGIQDLVGFGNAGVYVAHGQARNTYGPVYLKVAAFGYDDGWTEDRYPRLPGDVNGDGRDDVVGFGHSATYVNLS